MSGRAVEAAGDVQTLLLDKTGTITLGNRMASAFFPVGGHSEQELADAAQLASLADETPEGRSIVVLAKERFAIRERDLGASHDLRPLLGHDPDVWPRPRRPSDPQGRRRVRASVGSTEQGGTVPDELDADRRAHLPGRLDPPRGRRRTDDPRRHRAEGRREAGHPGEVRRDAPDGHPHRHDHRRQPAHCGRHRPGGRRRRLPGRGHPRGQDGPHQVRARGREARRHDRRRHQRRPGAGPGRRGRGHEHRDHGGQRGRQHGRPRLQPDQAHRRGRDRQAAADHPGLAHDVLDRQRRGQVLRHHPGAVRRHLPAAQRAQHHEAAQPAERRALGGDLQRPRDRGPDPPGPARRAVPGRVGSAAILRRNVFIYGVGGIIVPFIFIKLIDLILVALHAY